VTFRPHSQVGNLVQRRLGGNFHPAHASHFLVQGFFSSASGWNGRRSTYSRIALVFSRFFLIAVELMHALKRMRVALLKRLVRREIVLDYVREFLPLGSPLVAPVVAGALVDCDAAGAIAGDLALSDGLQRLVGPALAKQGPVHPAQLGGRKGGLADADLVGFDALGQDLLLQVAVLNA